MVARKDAVSTSVGFSVTLRKALMLALLSLPVIMVSLLGYVAYTTSIQIIDELGQRVIHQTSERVRAEVATLLNQASAISKANADLVQNVAPSFDRLANDFRRQMEQFPEFSYLSYTEPTGDYLHVQREPSGRILRQRISGAMKSIAVWQAGEWKSLGAATPTQDSQTDRPYYRVATHAGQQAWTDVYMFGNVPENQYPGLTCATPVYNASKELLGVLTADFSLSALGDYLGTLQVFDSGEAFIINGQQIIAHPDASKVVAQTLDGKAVFNRLDQSKDPMMRAFLGAMEGGSASPIAEYQWTVDGVDYLGFTEPLLNVQGLDWSVAILLAKGELTASVEKATQMVLWIAIASLVTLVFVGVILAQAIAQPLRRLTAEVARIGQFDIDPVPLPETWLWEVARLSQATEEMKTGLRSFGKFVPIDLVRSVMTTGIEAELGGEERRLTVLFSDIVGFTTVAERLTPSDLIDLLGQYMGAMTEEIIATHGTVDKYIGDAIMAFWGAPKTDLDHAHHACDAALRNVARLAVLREHWRLTGQPEIHCRIGINTGPLVVGNMGSEHRLNYTVIGDAVNLAARLEGLNKLYGTAILVSEFTAAEVADTFLCRPLERVAVKGKSQGVLVYELIDWNERASESQCQLVALSHEALKAYAAQQFQQASKAYQAILAIQPNDLMAKEGLERCAECLQQPPGLNWSAIRSMN